MKTTCGFAEGRLAALGLGLAILLAGCGGGSGGAVTAVPDPGSSNSTVTTPVVTNPVDNTTTQTPGVPSLSVLAGQPGGSGNVDGPAGVAALGGPGYMAFDRNGDLVVTDLTNRSIRKLDRQGNVSTVRAITTLGIIGTALMDSQGNLIVSRYRPSFPSDYEIVRSSLTGVETVLAAGPALYATPVASTTLLDGRTATVSRPPSAMALDAEDNLYLAFPYGVRKLTPGGVMTTLAGDAQAAFGWVDGTGTAARFGGSLVALTIDNRGNVYVAEQYGRVRKITPDGVVSTVVIGLGQVWGVAVDAAGNVYAADMSANRIQKIAPDGKVSVVVGSAGTLGSGLTPGCPCQIGMAVDRAGVVFIADRTEATLWAIAPDGTVRRAIGYGPPLVGVGTLQGWVDGQGPLARFKGPAHLATDASGNVYVADLGNTAVRSIAPNGQVRTVYRSTTETTTSFMSAMTADSSGNVYLIGDSNLSRVDPAGNRQVLSVFEPVISIKERFPAATAGQILASVSFTTRLEPRALVRARDGGFYVADNFGYPGNMPRLAYGVARRLGPNGALIGYVAGRFDALGWVDSSWVDGHADVWAIATDSTGNLYCLYCQGGAGDGLSKYTPDGQVTTLPAGFTSTLDLGNDVFDPPPTMVADDRGNVYVASPTNHTVQKISPTGQVTTVVGQRGKRGFVPGALPGVLNGPRGLALVGRTLYISMQNAVVQVTDLP